MKKKSQNVVVNEHGRLEQVDTTPRHSEIMPVLLLIAVPLLITALKFLPMTSGAAISQIFSLTSLPDAVAAHVQRLMLMSVGAIIVVIFRLTLGIRVLGPVRPILIALAYQMTGFVVGTLFLVGVMIIIAVIRPLLRSSGMPYFARIAIVLSVVSGLVVITLKIGLSTGGKQLLSVGLLPVVVLTFAAEGFAKTLYHEGVKSAAWRALMTIAVATLIKAVVALPGIYEFFVQYPEILMTQIGSIYLIARFFDYRALEFLNPKLPYVKTTIRNKKVRGDQNDSKKQRKGKGKKPASSKVLVLND